MDVLDALVVVLLDEVGVELVVAFVRDQLNIGWLLHLLLLLLLLLELLLD